MFHSRPKIDRRAFLSHDSRPKSGAELDAAFEQVFEMRDGKVARLENKPDQEAWTAAWS
jgi:hypothetical protein